MRRPNATLRTPIPVVRASVFAVVGTVLGVSAHHLATDGPVPWAPGAAATAALLLVGLAGARRPRSLTTVVAASSGAQAGLHLWLTLTAHPHHAAHMAMGGDSHAAWHERPHSSMAMTAVHAVAAVIVAVLLHRADAVCWSLARGVTAAAEAVRIRLAMVWARVPGPPTSGDPGLPVLPAERMEPRPPPTSAALADVVVRRGPPSTGLVFVN
ncbi:hypothetical protein [Streptomyces sp. MK37H]|uniref:hypothetical protein n=1 Tax=Streptomyces sp. MK37H TaxID=2699117 RepID=UPI001B392C0A|nr:hypothetical protein [Streptomyces sp. MK37H]MBP8535522.1 hypothetical protein [Streptomyces sp. MK37H]